MTTENPCLSSGRAGPAGGPAGWRGVLSLLVVACASGDGPITQAEYDARKEAVCRKLCDLDQRCDPSNTETLEECLASCDEELFLDVESYPCTETFLELHECIASLPDCEAYDRLSDADLDPSAPCHEELRASQACNEAHIDDP